MTDHPALSDEGGLRRRDWILIFGFWALIAAAVIVRTIYNNGVVPLILDTDDAMRLAVVRDFLAGQSWFDISQHRLNTPFGAQLHWSRLVDLPIAGLMLLLRPLAGDLAETVAVVLWPLILLLIFLILSARLSVRLVGKGAVLPGIVLPVLSLAMLPEFTPGRIDHHNVQIVLVTALASATIAAYTSMRAAALAGILAATTLAIGTESLPAIAAALFVFGLIWVSDADKAPMMRAFGLAFGAATAVHLAIAQPPQNWLQPACDALSAPYVLAGVLVAALFAALPVLPLAGRTTRFVALVGAGVVTLGILIALYPQCLGGPYAELDPWIKENWVPRIAEAKPVWSSIIAVPGVTIAIMTPLIAALAVIFWCVRHTENRIRVEWMILGVFLIFGFLVTCLQIRGGRLAAPLAIPAGAWLIVAMRARYLDSRRLADAGKLVSAWLVFAGVFIAVAVTAVLLPFGLVAQPETVSGNQSTSERRIDARHACLLPDAFADLRRGSTEAIMAPIDLGAHLLAFTPHVVVGAPYHRNSEGMLATVNFFSGTAEAALEIASERSLTLVVTCDGLPEMRGYETGDTNTFAKHLASGDLPDWLEEITPDGATLQLYRVHL